MPLFRTTPLVQLLLRIDTSWPLSPILYCSGHFSALPKLYLYPSFILCTTSLSHPQSAATCDSRYLKQSTCWIKTLLKTIHNLQVFNLWVENCERSRVLLPQFLTYRHQTGFIVKRKQVPITTYLGIPINW